ncbi:cytochrome oxidase complex assembly protein 1-domain-containing protein [Echria macrotheca]|uniref:Cytochrome oxidase complex assembly protein 1-domain-containing protein n=1 Tax=Echria macrotheca TaxID=438768 RepID=A0AAJ0BNM1_9PEZI|nr:cytochrome oxidase complex assembly protein 1-domain-containing protein [Echria macrotheca]
MLAPFSRTALRGSPLSHSGTRTRICLPRIIRAPTNHHHEQRRTLIAAPKPGDGPLLERRSDRELPNISQKSHWRKTLPLFAALVAAASLAIFNYQKLSSPVVAGTLYALRTSPKARAALGDEIYFAAQIPWIRGGMNQLHGRIDIRFAVKGTKDEGTMRFVSHRATPRGVFETMEWSLEMADGRRIDLLEDGDPFRAMTGAVEPEEDEITTRGYRK